jgi:hypothetical protein
VGIEAVCGLAAMAVTRGFAARAVAAALTVFGNLMIKKECARID